MTPLMPDWFVSFATHPAALLALGGGCGANARYWIGAWVRAVHGTTAFPWATFAINVLGSVLLGLAAALCLNHPNESRKAWYLLFGTGFCGGFTTFSAFSLETLQLLQSERPWLAAGYVLGSAAAGVFGVWLALKLAGARAA